MPGRSGLKYGLLSVAGLGARGPLTIERIVTDLLSGYLEDQDNK